MPPISINNKPFLPTIIQKREMHFYLQMLLHANGSLPALTRLQSFWEQRVGQKIDILRKEMMESKYDSNSVFALLDQFYRRLIDQLKERNPTLFKKDQLLYRWHSTLGKTFEEFRNNELERWTSYTIYQQKYERDIRLNQSTFDDQQIKNLDKITYEVFSLNLKELCYKYFSKYSRFDVKNFDLLIQSVLVTEEPLVNIMAKSNHIGSIRNNYYKASDPKLLASLDL